MESLATLNTLLLQAEAERDAAQALLRQLEAQAAKAQDQVAHLQEYRAQYQQRWNAQFRQSGAIELVQCYQSFAQRLDQAIAMQTNAVQQAQRRADQAREQAVAREQRVAAVRKLIERRQSEHRRENERREQRSTDEAALRRHSSVSRLSPSMI